MKKILLPILLCFTTSVFAQRIQTSETTANMSQGYQSCYVLFLPGTNQKEIEKSFGKTMKDYGAKGDSKKDEFFFDNATIQTISENPVDVYSISTEVKNGTELKVWIDMGGGTFLSASSNEIKSAVAQTWLRSFGVDQVRAAYSAALAEQQKSLERLMNDQKNLEQQQSQLENRIKDCETTISQSRKELETNSGNQQAKQKEIAGQQVIVDEAKKRLDGVE